MAIGRPAVRKGAETEAVTEESATVVVTETPGVTVVLTEDGLIAVLIAEEEIEAEVLIDTGGAVPTGEALTGTAVAGKTVEVAALSEVGRREAEARMHVKK